MSVDKGKMQFFVPVTLSRYIYTADDPINYTDPGGKFISPIEPEPWFPLLVGPQGPIHGSDKGDQPSHNEQFQDEWDSLSENCQSGLRTAVGGALPGMLGALNRAWAAEDQLMTAVAGTSVDWTTLAAIGIRETGFRNIVEDRGGGVRGFGVGFFQLTAAPGASAVGTVQGILSLSVQAQGQLAAGILAGDLQRLSGRIDDPNLLLAAALHQYNAGGGNAGVANAANTGGISALDQGTAKGNYVSSIMNLQDCFK